MLLPLLLLVPAGAQTLHTLDAAARVAPLATPEMEEAIGWAEREEIGRRPISEGGAPPPGGPVVKAESAILVDGRTGLVLWQKNARQRRPMASTTKIMTATLLLETADLSDTVVASKTAAATPYANLHLRPGERIPMEDLLYAIMLRSANDGCVAAAEHVAGSEAAFVALMNEKAREIGALDTHFVTSSGLHHPDHYSTAEDLARIAVYAVRNPLFNELCGARARAIRRSIGTKDCLVRNHNKLLQRYPGADGIKTGYVRQSGRCLVASATRREGGLPWRLIAVVLNSTDTYADTAAMLDYGFARFQPVLFARKGEQVGMAPVPGGTPAEVPAIAAEDVIAVLPRGTLVGSGVPERRLQLASLKAPVRRDQPIGTVCGVVDGRVRAAVPVVAGAEAQKEWAASYGRYGGWGLALALLAWGPRYARALTKAPRRRRRRFTARGRGVDRRRPRPGRRAGGDPAWNEGGPARRQDHRRWA